MFRVRNIFSALVLALLAAPAANAAPITYSFSVTATSGPLNGQTSTGTFTFDSGIIPAGGGEVNQTGLLTDLDFTWNGIDYNQATANTGTLFFDSSGLLTGAFFGTSCVAGGCIISSGIDNWDVFASSDVAHQFFNYSTPLSSGVFVSDSASLVPSTVPEPTSMSLLALGLLGGAITRSRRRSNGLRTGLPPTP
jgi:hypothetical protein